MSNTLHIQSAPTAPPPDRRACAVAKAVYDELRPASVIVFGSRARGDFRPDSDIDLMVIFDSDAAGGFANDLYSAGSRAAFAKARELYGGFLNVDLLQMTESQFQDRRRARNHVAGQAARDGFDMNGDKIQPDDQEPTNWPDIRQRIANAERNLRDMEVLIEGEGSQEAIGFHAQQAIENALKGWISALDDDYGNTHDLGDLMAIVRSHPEEEDTPAGEQLVWLTRYAVKYRYEGAVVEMDDRWELLSIVSDTVSAIIERTRALAGADEEPEEQPQPRDSQQPHPNDQSPNP